MLGPRFAMSLRELLAKKLLKPIFITKIEGHKLNLLGLKEGLAFRGEVN